MNALTNALSEIKMSIPEELLHVGFNIDNNPNIPNLTSLDDKILFKFLRPRVLVDCDIVGGTEVIVPLDTLSPDYQLDFYCVYKIPPELLNNRTITSVLNLTYLPYRGYVSQGQMAGNTPNMYGNGQTSVLQRLGDRIGNTFSDSPPVSNAQLDLIAHNTVSIYSNFRVFTSYGLRCVVSNEENLQNFTPRSYKSFAQLCVLGVKAYLYNKLIVKVNQGYLSGGLELGQFKSTLDSYEGALQEYNTYLKEVWTSTAYMADAPRYHRMLKSMLNPGL
jgi:hypothetical protein